MDDLKKIKKSYAQQFKENNYVLVKNFITKEMAQYLYDYTLLKSEAIKTMILRGFLPYDNFLGNFHNVGSDGQAQVPDSFSMYGDFAMETLLNNSTKKMEEITVWIKEMQLYIVVMTLNIGEIHSKERYNLKSFYITTM